MRNKINVFLAMMMMCIVPTTQSHAASQSVDSAIQQLNFALTVEWDQKDTKFRQQAIQTFVTQIAQAQKSGVTNEQLLTALKAQMPNAQFAKDIEGIAMTAKQNHLSNEASNQLVAQYLSKSRAQGASWSDQATIAVVAVAVFALMLVVLMSGGTVEVVDYSGCYYGVCYDDYGNSFCC